MKCRQWSVLVCATVLLLAGCARKSEEAAPPAAADGAAASSDLNDDLPSTAKDASPRTLTPDLPAADPTESGLSIKRGIAKSAGDHGVLRPCNEQADLYLVDEGDDMLAQLFAEGMKTAYVELYGERAPVPEDLPAAKGHAGIFVIEQLLYAGAPDDDGGCVPAINDAEVTARGNEPFWTAQITDAAAIWKQQDPALEAKLPAVQSQDVEGTVSYGAKSDKHSLQLVIAAQPCRDLVSDEYFAFAARATFDGKEFKGCARVGK